LRALAITGPRSSRPSVTALQQATLGAGHSFEELSKPTLDSSREAIARFAPDYLLIFGGDGTLNRNLAILKETKLPFLAVATGSGNDFAMAHGVRDAGAALELWQRVCRGEVHTQAVDLGDVRCHGAEQGRLFSCCLNVGVDADAASRAERLPTWLKSRRGYFLAGAISVLTYRPTTLRVSSAEASLDEQAWLVSVSNTPTYGGGLKIAPQAKTDDGLLDITFLRGIPRAGLIRHFPKILSGQHVGISGVQVFATKRLRIETSEPQPIWADGEYMGMTPAEVVIVPQVAKVLSPKPS